MIGPYEHCIPIHRVKENVSIYVIGSTFILGDIIFGFCFFLFIFNALFPNELRYQNHCSSLSAMDLQDLEKGSALVTQIPNTSAEQSTQVIKFSNCTFAWKDISYSVNTNAGEKHILKNVTGCAEKGKQMHHNISINYH